MNTIQILCDGIIRLSIEPVNSFSLLHHKPNFVLHVCNENKIYTCSFKNNRTNNSFQFNKTNTK